MQQFEIACHGSPWKSTMTWKTIYLTCAMFARCSGLLIFRNRILSCHKLVIMYLATFLPVIIFRTYGHGRIYLRIIITHLYFLRISARYKYTSEMTVKPVRQHLAFRNGAQLRYELILLVEEPYESYHP